MPRNVSLTFTLLIVVGCGTGEYNKLLEQSIQTMGREAPMESDDAALAEDGEAQASRGRQGGRFGVPAGGRQSTLGQAVDAANRPRILQNARGIVAAATNFESTRGFLPMRNILASDGQPLLSWRVAMLQELDPNLYRLFHLDEPWDSEHNEQFLDQMPDVYDVGMRLERGNTVVLAVEGDDTVFPGGDEKVKLVSVRDGLDKTAMFAVAAHQSAVPWTKPQDLNLDDDLVTALADSKGTFYVAFLAGNVQRVSVNDAETVRALFTRDGGESLNLGDL